MRRKKQSPDEEPEEGVTPVGKYEKEGPPDGKPKEVGAIRSKKRRSPDDGTSDEESEDEPSTPGEPKMPSQGGTPNGNGGPDWKSTAKKAAIGATVGAAALLVGVPACIAGLGFTGAGIAAGSIAAKMMSVAAIANGGGVAAGSTVAVLQSIGAAGLSAGAQIGLASAGGSLGAAIGAWVPWKKGPDDKPKKGGTPGDKPEEVATRNAGEVPDPEVLPDSLLSSPPSQELEP